MALPDNVTEKTRSLSIDGFQKLMQLAFDQVCDPTDWKAPIDCIVPWGVANVYMEAIKFMTATEVQAERCADAVGNPSFRLTSMGYRNGPAGP